ncbi:hypothetical protein T4C_1755 [Trichinella pseudospiralis]|uniref:Uncharacterized protein n=1 Tax=Trichinella pseudospiralis TaxID=6337 RepID=A0A0V1KCU0_TRIPS|nr:hypothetical protein T4C_1755 [Trichinella pseudospiralis]
MFSNSILFKLLKTVCLQTVILCVPITLIQYILVSVISGKDIWHQKREWESNLTSPSSRTPRVDADLTSWDDISVRISNKEIIFCNSQLTDKVQKSGIVAFCNSILFKLLKTVCLQTVILCVPITLIQYILVSVISGKDIWHQKREWESNLTSPSSRTPRVDADLTSWDGNRSRAFGRICTNN